MERKKKTKKQKKTIQVWGVVRLESNENAEALCDNVIGQSRKVTQSADIDIVSRMGSHGSFTRVK